MAGTWDEEDGNEPSLILERATAEPIAATDPVVGQLIVDIDAGFAADDAAGESIFNRGESYSRLSTN